MKQFTDLVHNYTLPNELDLVMLKRFDLEQALKIFHVRVTS